MWVRTCLFDAKMSAAATEMTRRSLWTGPVLSPVRALKKKIVAHKTYRFRCSNLLKIRPHDGIGHEWDFCG